MAALGLSACSPASPPTTTAPVTSAPPPTEGAPIGTAASTIPTRRCAESVIVSPGGSAGYIEDSIRAGPVLFGNARTFGEVTIEWGPDANDRHPVIKIPLTVAAGHSPTVEIAPMSIDWTALIYNTADFRSTGRYELTEGTSAMTFQACQDRNTLFNGGVIVSSPGCLQLSVTDGNDGDESTVIIPIAVSEC